MTFDKFQYPQKSLEFDKSTQHLINNYGNRNGLQLDQFSAEGRKLVKLKSISRAHAPKGRN